MAEYIDRNKLNKKKKYLFQTKGMPFPKSEYFIKADDFMSIPAANVIERSKIDNAVKEMDKLASHKIRPISFDQAVAIDMCINILKRNIGE